MSKKNLEYTLIIVGTFVTVWVLSFVLRKAIDYFIKKNSKQLFVDPTNFIFLKNAITFVLFSIGTFWIFTKIPYFTSLGNALFASAGVFAAILGFASQKALANIIGGIFILIFKPFRIGDVIEIASGKKGIVEEITLRHTVIKDYEFRRIIIPNSIISEDTITNSSITDKKIRKQIDFGIAYDSNIELAESIIQDEIKNHPNFIDNRTPEEKDKNEPPIPVKVVSLAEYSVTLRAFVWTKDFDTSIELERDVLRSIKLSFDKNGIEIPFPYRTIVFKNKPKDFENGN
jgi:small-conductance mechanosensitive channel